MTQSEHDADAATSSGERPWRSLPKLSGRVRLTTHARLIETNELGFSVESSERILVPHLYRLDFETELDGQARGLVSGSSARAVWCHLVPLGKPHYRAGFRLPGEDGDNSRERAALAADQRRSERELLPNALEMRLEATAGVRLLAMLEGPDQRVRFSTSLLPSLRTEVRLELADGISPIELGGQVINVGPLGAESGVPRSWLEVSIDDQTSESFRAWVDRTAG